MAWLHQHYLRLVKLWADSAYRGRCVDEGECHGIDVEIVKREPGQKGFVAQPRPWVIERTSAWLLQLLATQQR